VAAALLPLVRDTGWFFDTELLVLAQRSGLRIQEVPVDWVDDPDSRVDIVATAIADLRGIARLGRALLTGALPLAEVRRSFARAPHADATPAGLPGQLVRFAAVGVASTLAYLVLFGLSRAGLGAQWANLVALLVTAVANTAANRRLTFGVVGRHRLARHHLQGLFVFGLGLTFTSGSLARLGRVSAAPPRASELAVVVAANLATTVLRFVLLRWWFVHRRHRAERAYGPSRTARPTR
jgi:putative flippase GtrA